MKIKKSKTGNIRMTAENEVDSLLMLELVESWAGQENNPARASIKKRKDLEERGLIKPEGRQQ
jgi:hypothetical protein